MLAQGLSTPKASGSPKEQVDPELRLPQLVLAAFHALQEMGPKAFLSINDGEGWMLTRNTSPRRLRSWPRRPRKGTPARCFRARAAILSLAVGAIRRRILGGVRTPRRNPRQASAAARFRKKTDSESGDAVAVDLFGNPLETDLFGSPIYVKPRKR